MSAGIRSPLGFWVGGAGAGAAQAGVRSPFAFWLGGAGATSVAPTAGVRGLLAPWLGGAAAKAGQAAGVRGLLAFWLGGGAPGGETPSPAEQTLGGGNQAGIDRFFAARRRIKRLETISAEMKEAPAIEMPALVSEFRDVFAEQIAAARRTAIDAAVDDLSRASERGSLAPLATNPVTGIPATAAILVDDDLVAISVAMLRIH